MANPIAVPGTVVSSGAAVSPGGAQGPTVVSANANNKATLGTDSLLLVQGTAAGVAATTHAQTVSGDDPQLTNARTPTAHQASHVTGSDQIPLASASTKGLLNQTSGNTTDFIDGTNNSQPLQPVIWSARLRSFNATGNQTFEVDQRNAGATVTNPASGTLIIDRWRVGKAGTMALNTAQLATNSPVPGTNFYITGKYLWLNLTTQQATLGTGDQLNIIQTIEAPRLRELLGDVHSLSILASTNVTGGLKFGVTIRDVPTTKCLTKLCTIPSPATNTLITLPNLPVFASGGNWSVSPGVAGYEIVICLAAGTTVTTAANDVWQNSANFAGAVGQDNFAAKPVNSSISLIFVQHEPGALCTTPIDCPFEDNLTACQRFFTKSYPYATAVGAANNTGAINLAAMASTSPFAPVRFKRTMAKTPTITGYSPATGAVNNVRNTSAPADLVIASVAAPGDDGFGGFNATAPATNWGCQYHYTADTGW
jgi:hypothetical protein